MEKWKVLLIGNLPFLGREVGPWDWSQGSFLRGHGAFFFRGPGGLGPDRKLEAMMPEYFSLTVVDIGPQGVLHMIRGPRSLNRSPFASLLDLWSLSSRDLRSLL